MQEGRADEAQELVRQSQKRGMSWLARGSNGCWRPRKRYRKAAHEWLISLDNQIRMGTSCGGLEHFQVPEDPQQRPPPLQWPLLQIASDRGLDGMAALSYIKKELNINCCDVPDPSHDVSNDVCLAIQRAGLWPHEVLMQATWNTPHGPWAEDTRYRQVVEAMRDLHDFEGPASQPLWQAFAPKILHDLGMDSHIGDDGIQEQLWEICFDASPWQKKGTKMNANRFMGAASRPMQEDQHWHMRLWGYTHICIELDMLQGKEFNKMVIPTAAPGDGQDHPEDTAQLRQPLPEEKMLRRACQNAMVVAVMMLSDPDNQYRQRCICTAAKPWSAWHSQQNELLRSTTMSGDWLERQLSGDFLKSVAKGLACLSSRQDISHCGMQVDLCQRSDLPDADDIEVVREDQFASLLASLTLELAGCRLRRCLWMLAGWPAKSVLMRGGDAPTGAQAAQDLKRQHDLWTKLTDSTCAEAQKVVKRSSFNNINVQQLVSLLDGTGWVLNDTLEAWMRRRHSRCLATQVVEDAFKRQRRREAVGQSRAGGLLRTWGILMEKEVLGSVHHYKEISGSQVNLPRAASLDANCFKPNPAASKLPLSKVIGFNATPGWYSPSPEESCVEHADHAMLEYLDEHSLQPQELSNAWLTCLLKHASCLVRERVGSDGSPGPWLFPLCPIKRSASLGWPAKSVKAGPSETVTYVLDLDPAVHMKLHWIVLLDLGAWEALELNWRPPLWAHVKLQCPMKSLTGLLAVPLDHQPVGLHIIAARNGFWTLPKFLLWKFVRHFGLATCDDKDTFKICWDLVQHLLDTSDEETLEIMRHRCAKMSPASVLCNEEFMKLDEAADILDQAAMKDFKSHKKKLLDQTESHSVFVKCFQDKIKEVRDAGAAKGKGKRGPRGRGGLKGGGPWGDRLYPTQLPSDGMTQPEMKELLPPGARVWCGYQQGTWQGHLPPHAMIGRSWHIYGGQRETGMRLLRELWQQYLSDHAMDSSQCPVPGLFG